MIPIKGECLREGTHPKERKKRKSYRVGDEGKEKKVNSVGRERVKKVQVKGTKADGRAG